MQTHTSTLTNAIQMNTANVAVGWFTPLVDGSMTPHQWIEWLMEANAERKDGTKYPAIYAASGAAPFATSQIVKSLWAAQKMGYIGYAHAIHQAKCFQTYAESATHALAGQLGHDAQEVPAASVLIRSENDGGSTRTTGMKDQIREALDEATKRFNAGQITREQYKEVALQLQDELQQYQATEAMGDGEGDHQGSSKDKVANDEGALQVALHTPQELWRYNVSDILGSEALMTGAAKEFGGIDLPTDHPDWGTFLGRTAEALAVSVDYADGKTSVWDRQNNRWTTAKQLEKEKSELRMQVAENGIGAAPKKARWVVNHLARRLWRDSKVLERIIESHERRKEGISAQIMREERYNLPARASRIMDSRPIDSGDEPRQFYLIWEIVDESDLVPNTYEGMMQGRYDIETLSNAQGRAEAILHHMKELYKLVREVDEALRPIWNTHASEGMPTEPPIYWNHRGFYLTEEDAVAAMETEAEERRAANKAATIEGAGTVLQQMLEAQGLTA